MNSHTGKEADGEKSVVFFSGLGILRGTLCAHNLVGTAKSARRNLFCDWRRNRTKRSFLVKAEWVRPQITQTPKQIFQEEDKKINQTPPFFKPVVVFILP